MHPRKANALIHENSLYLRQHAHNPVEWLPWGTTAFQRAQAENKPILLSIGYASCHWCHVMERESFENLEVAAFMNEHFINIKVDREERPDVDQVYMDAIQALTGSGGWPLHAFLTSDGKPFYGGTYFPPKNIHKRPSWKSVLEHMVYWWHTENEKVVDQANRLLQHSASLEELFLKIPVNEESECIETTSTSKLKAGIMQQADQEWGGFGGAPKFPQFAQIRFLLHYGAATNDREVLDHAVFSLRSMVNGGIYDQLSGGLARYSTDKYWFAPHFEKMLYDNAGLLTTISEALRVQPDPVLTRALENTIDFCYRELCTESGLFAASIDADSEGEEGRYYTFLYEEVASVLGAETEAFAARFGITPEGNWEQGRNILYLTDHSAGSPLLHSDLLPQDRLEACLEALRKFQRARVRPVTDVKPILSWNAMFLKGLCDAAMATGNEAWKQRANELLMVMKAQFINSENSLSHLPVSNTQPASPAFLDDYAYYIQAVLAHYTLTADASSMEEARHWTVKTMQDFHDPATGLFFFRNSEEDWLPLRKKAITDGAYPSGNAIMAENLQRIGQLTGDFGWLVQSNTMYARLETSFLRYPSSFAGWLTGFFTAKEDTIRVHLNARNPPVFITQLHRLLPPDIQVVFEEQVFPGELMLCGQGACHPPIQGFASLSVEIARIRAL
ncbi:MAG: thioredoxin domain-containing protein [Ferruginibacter sp.]